MGPKTTIELPFSPEDIRGGRVRTAIELRLPVGTGYEVHEFEYGKSYLVTFDPCFVNADDLDAVQNAEGLDITFIPAISPPRVAAERARCAKIARSVDEDPAWDTGGAGRWIAAKIEAGE